MKYQLFLFDVDSTLIEQEVIDLLASQTPYADRVAEITERAMRGELNFDAALVERVALLKGIPESVFADVLKEIVFTPGARELLTVLKSRGAKVGVVSGGFHNILDNLFGQFELDYLKANTLAVEEGVLTGEILGSIINRTAKARALKEFASSYEIEIAETVAVGDGANDLEMILNAGLGISFCGKPILQEAADVSINERDLLKILEVI